MYRTVTLYALQNGQIEWNGEILYRKLQEDILLGKIDISVLPKKDGTMRIFLSDEDVSGKIRELEVARNVSAIATLPFVRNFVDEQLHRLGAKGCVMDGRDIGTAVFPNANLKIFMTADAEIRAQRRVKQMEEAMNPLRKADDAIVLDNSHMTVEEQMVWLDGILRERFNLSLL